MTPLTQIYLLRERVGGENDLELETILATNKNMIATLTYVIG